MCDGRFLNAVTDVTNSGNQVVSLANNVGINNITRYILLFGLSIKDSIPYVILFAE